MADARGALGFLASVNAGGCWDKEAMLGGRAALPMWMDFMRAALKDVPQGMLPRPSGLVSVRIDRRSGKLAGEEGDAVFEVVPQDRVPEAADAPAAEEEGRPSAGGVEELF